MICYLINKGCEIMLRVSLFSFGVVVLLTGCGEVTSAPVQEMSEEDKTVVLKSENQEMLALINKARSVSRDCGGDNGVMGPSMPLEWSEVLYASAYEHSNDLAMSDTFSHYGSGTEYDITAMNKGGGRSSFYERILSQGYGEFYALGENIAAGQRSIEEVMEAWLKSPSHCANIMSDNFTEVGMAVVVNEESTYGIYWTQNFGGKS